MNEYDYFKDGNYIIPYAEVDHYECRLDMNGNPSYRLYSKRGFITKLTGCQAYAFDVTRVR